MADDTFGYGQQDPVDTSHEHNVFVFKVNQILAGKYFTRVVQVMAVDTDAKTVDVQIATNQLDGQGNSSPHGTINSIPFAGGQAGTVAFKVTPAVGDLGVMVVSDRDLSAVKSSKAIANPGSTRKNSAADGVYLLSILNKRAPTQFFEWTDDGVSITAAHGNTLTSDASGWHFGGNVIIPGNLQLGGAVQAADGTEYLGTIQTSGDVVAGTISLKSHHTSGVTTGTGTSGPPVP